MGLSSEDACSAAAGLADAAAMPSVAAEVAAMNAAQNTLIFLSN